MWHTGVPVAAKPGLGFQLWLALPASEETYWLRASTWRLRTFRKKVRRAVGWPYTAKRRSAIPTPGSMNYLVVELKDGEQWRYTPPTDHDVAVDFGGRRHGQRGRLGGRTGQLAIFEERQVRQSTSSLMVIRSLCWARRPSTRMSLSPAITRCARAKKTLAQGEAEDPPCRRTCCAVKAVTPQRSPQILPLKEKFQRLFLA